LRHPVTGGGGSDPYRVDQIKRYAPKSVLTFGRAISPDDYTAIAAQAPGVVRVRAEYAWNAKEQRAGATLFVGDDAAAVDSVRQALRTAADPNRPLHVDQASAVSITPTLTLRVDSNRASADIESDVRAALADSETGLFRAANAGVGRSFYFSEVYDACLSVEGVESVTDARFDLSRPDPVTGGTFAMGPQLRAASHEYFTLAEDSIYLNLVTA
jgi:hypothetical protein